MYAYVINLARSTDRRAHMTAQLRKAGMNYEFVSAVEGRQLDLADTKVFDPEIVANSGFRPGAAGAALSHLAVYRKILDDGVEIALVLEDDVVLPQNLSALSDAVAPHMRGAEIVLLNFHSDTPCQVTKAGSVVLPADRLLVRVVTVGTISSGAAYVVTREACNRMVTGGLPVRTHPDDWGFHLQEGHIDSVRCVVPMPVANSTALRTTIDYFRPGSFQARFREAVSNIDFPVVQYVLGLKRRRNFRRFGWTGEAEFVEDLPVRENLRDS